jgi:acetyltransferase-like isoleucine patch superfamily enzyme
MEKNIKDMFKEKLIHLSHHIQDKQIVIWGGGTHGRIVTEAMKDIGMDFEYVIDSMRVNEDIKIFGKEVKEPAFIKGGSRQYFVIVAMTYFYKEVKNQLIEFGYQESEDFSFFGEIGNVIEPVNDIITEYTDEFGNQIIGEVRAFNSKIIFKGFNNKIIFDENVVLRNCNISFHSNGGFCSIGSNSIYKGNMHIGQDCVVKIGKNLWVTNHCLITVAEGTSVEIGDDCMFASKNQIRSHDSHAIFSVEDGRRLNRSKSIRIGNHVWLAYASIVLSGSEISDGSIIGHSAVVKSRIPNNCIAVGIPARVVKRNIAWNKESLLKFPFAEYKDGQKYFNLTETDL